MLAVSANQAIGGFLLIVWPPPILVEPFDYNGISRGRIAILLVALEIFSADRLARIRPAILAPVGDKTDVFCERLETG